MQHWVGSAPCPELASLPAELPPSWLGAGDAGFIASAWLPRKSSHVGGSNTKRGFSIEVEEQLSLGNVREGTWVQVASCSQHLCLIC